MFFRDVNGLQLGRFGNLSEHQPIVHYVSTRRGGVSQGAYASLNLSFKAGDAEKNVQENRRRLSGALGIYPGQLVFPAQTHSNHVGVADQALVKNEFPDTDALVAGQPGLCLNILVADCTPVLLFDPVKKVVAAIHAGWRGTVDLIAARTVEKMKRVFDVDPGNILAGIGPSISPQVYEVGDEVVERVRSVFGTAQNVVTAQNAGGKHCFDLWRANKLQLMDMGVGEDAIETAGLCVYQNHELFFSARKLKYNSGRFAAGIMIRE